MRGDQRYGASNDSPFFLGQRLDEIFIDDDPSSAKREWSQLGWAAARLEAHSLVAGERSFAGWGWSIPSPTSVTLRAMAAHLS